MGVTAAPEGDGRHKRATTDPLKRDRHKPRARDAGLAGPAWRLAEPALWDACLTALSQRALPVSEEEITGSLPDVARDRGPYDGRWQLAGDLLTHDETRAPRRTRHAQMAERQVGTKSGTGGPTGAPSPRGRTRPQRFPKLWELRGWR